MVWTAVVTGALGLLFTGGGSGEGENKGGLNLRSIIWLVVALIALTLLAQIWLSVTDTTLIDLIGADEWFVTRFIKTGVEGVQTGLRGWGALFTGIAGAGASLFKRN